MVSTVNAVGPIWSSNADGQFSVSGNDVTFTGGAGSCHRTGHRRRYGNRHPTTLSSKMQQATSTLFPSASRKRSPARSMTTPGWVKMAAIRLMLPLNGGTGENFIRGVGNGDDGNDNLTGSNGNDHISAGNSNDTIGGGAGSRRTSMAAMVTMASMATKAKTIWWQRRRQRQRCWRCR